MNKNSFIRGISFVLDLFPSGREDIIQIPTHSDDEKTPALFAQQISYSSPLPPPEILSQYEKVQPGLVKKIIEMTEAQGNHRRDLENRKLEADIKHQKEEILKLKLVSSAHLS